MKLIIGADLVPTESNAELFKSGNAEGLIGEELQMLLNEADYKIFNLEVPLTNVLSPIDKCGPALIASEDTIEGYKAIGVDCLTIANNHIMDQGVQGLKSTLDILENAKISYVGGGYNLEQATKPLIIEDSERKIGIYACAEHEFSIATKSCPGANPFDPLESLDHIAKLKAQCDYVVVLYHGGKEHYRYPSPNLQKICRKIIEKGANLVICQHSHCVGCEEKYNGGTIVYGQGNFLFDCSSSEFWQTSMLVLVDDCGEVSYTPLRKHDNVVRLANGSDADEIINAFFQRSEEIKQEGFIDEKYREFASSMLNQYLFAFSGIKRTFFYKVFDKLSGHRMTQWILSRKYIKEKKLALKNYIECEAHRELFLKGLKF